MMHGMMDQMMQHEEMMQRKQRMLRLRSCFLSGLAQGRRNMTCRADFGKSSAQCALQALERVTAELGKLRVSAWSPRSTSLLR